jgi:hypothetical protein
VKRLVVLLIVLAGGLAAAAFAIPSNAATVNGASISQQSLNSDLTAIANSPDYQCYLKAEQAIESNGEVKLPTVDGAGQTDTGGSHPTVTTSFADNYLDTEILHQLILGLAAKDHVDPTPQDLSAARASLAAQITEVLQEVEGSAYACGSTPVTGKVVLATLPASFVNENVQFDAAVSLYEDDAAGVGASTTDLERYFGDHPAEFATACFTVAGYSSQSAAQAARAEVASGTPFATEASAAGGGPRGCGVIYGVADQLPAGADLDDLPLNTVSQPLDDNGNYFLIEITKKTPSSFAAARADVEQAVQTAGAGNARVAINAAERRAVIQVNPRYGRWMTGQTEIAAPTPPLVDDLLNRSVDSPATATAATAGSSSGQAP